MGHLLCCAIALALLPLARPARAEPERWAMVGGWDVGFYSATQGCLAYAQFNSTNFFIGFDTKENLAALDITVLDERWVSITPGTTYAITLALGNEPPWTLDMLGVFMDGAPGLNILIDASMPRSARFIEEFQHETRMTWSYGEAKLGQFTLRGSRRAFTEVLACQRSYQTRLPLIVDDDSPSPLPEMPRIDSKPVPR